MHLLWLPVVSSAIIGTAISQNTATFWSDYPPCEQQCHQTVYGNRSCTFQNTCSCGGCLCLTDSCLCETSAWLLAVAQCIGQECGESAVSEAAGIANTACDAAGYPLVVSEQSLINEGLAAIPSTTAPTTVSVVASTASNQAPVTVTQSLVGTTSLISQSLGTTTLTFQSPGTTTPTFQSPGTTAPTSQPTSSSSNSGSGGLSTAVVAVISVLSCLVVFLIVGGLCLWRYKVNKKRKTRRDIIDPRRPDGRSDPGDVDHAATLPSESTVRYSAIPGWVGAVELPDRPSAAHSESNFSGSTRLSPPSELSGLSGKP